MAPLGTLLFNNPYLCGNLRMWPSSAALNASVFDADKYAGYSSAEAVLVRYLQQNSSQLVLFGLHNTKVTLDLDALSIDAPFYFTAVILTHLGRGYTNANNLRGLPSPEQGVLACQLLQVTGCCPVPAYICGCLQCAALTLQQTVVIMGRVLT